MAARALRCGVRLATWRPRCGVRCAKLGYARHGEEGGRGLRRWGRGRRYGAARASTGVADTSKVIGSVRRITRAEFAEETAALGA